MRQEDILKLIEIVFDESLQREERFRAKLQLEELIRTLVPE